MPLTLLRIDLCLDRRGDEVVTQRLDDRGNLTSRRGRRGTRRGGAQRAYYEERKSDTTSKGVLRLSGGSDQEVTSLPLKNQLISRAALVGESEP